MTKIVYPGGPGRPTIFEVEWWNPSTERVQENNAFWELVRGPVDPFLFDHAGTIFEACHFEAGSMKHEAVGRGHRMVVRFRAMKAVKKEE